ncbi:hypothetical protein [Ralstonia pseudosolanacearum]|uniref:hypothetical protein n=1 Tax=Ralstonia pseudosolanacearum TaxID=1310165 RepID=UPI0026761FFF|nr:hypothetical protein [Ralstonia pseudosolanacearum]MDO3523967.1 hypothetical protein [Ralstonia pseudosolanacearum]MDO3549459.1 hypothetical protein [Ralstonia pseudosolanacearum]MDO3553410.1 hypothetical protein [Ralstonia pseudosolanacearum]MDO3567270.1 hypothetical protein [Ralstonia pseudosolanacearum]MDO3582822.1 hypothetical protein [Ralstonia pseudosolanacearum]
MLSTPLYTKALDSAQTLDPLGTMAVNETLYRSVFPGINNVVRYIRVYSAICWMVRQIEETAEAETDPNIAEMSAAGLGKIQLLLTWYNKMQGVTALAGSERNFPEDDTRVKLSFRTLVGNEMAKKLEADPDYEVTRDGAKFLTAVEYRPSLVTGLQFLMARTAVADTYKLTDAGEALADAYEEVIAEHPWRDWLADVNTLHVTRDEVLEMGDMLRLDQPSENEQQAFLSRYYPEVEDQEDVSDSDWNRWTGLTLALRALATEEDASQEGGVTSDDIRMAMARGSTLAGTALDLAEVAEAQGWWANLQLRQYLRLAVETLFRYTQSWVHDATIAQGNRPRDIEDCAQGVGALLLKGLPPEHQASVAGMASSLTALQGGYTSFYAASPFVPELRLDARADALWDLSSFGQRTQDEAVALQEVYKALVYCALEAENLLVNPYVLQSYDAERGRLSLATLRSVFAQFREASPAEFIGHIVKHYVLLQHFSVVRSRTYDGRNRFVLMLGDNGLERVANQGLTVAGWLEDRLHHALLLLAQCGLIEEHDGGGYALTDAGRARLGR